MVNRITGRWSVRRNKSW